MIHYGHKLKDLRIEKGFTQAEVAGTLGLTQHRVSDIESAENMTLDTFEKYLAVLGLRLIVESDSSGSECGNFLSEKSPAILLTLNY